MLTLLIITFISIVIAKNLSNSIQEFLGLLTTILISTAFVSGLIQFNY